MSRCRALGHAALFLGLALAATRPSAASTAEPAFAQANEAYAAGRFAEAAAGYEKLLAGGVVSQALLYNLGNARYRLGDLGGAILMFEKAARLDPGDAEVRANLEFARTQAVDRTAPAGAQTPALFMERLLALTSLDVDAAVLSALWLAAGAMTAVVLLRRQGFLRRAAQWALVLMALPLAAGFGLVAVKGWRELTVVEAVVLKDRLDVVSGPGEDQTTLFTVHEGLKVRVQSVQGTWAQVVLSNGLNGWIPLDAAGII